MPTIHEKVSLQPYNSLALPAVAEYFCAVQTTSELFAALEFARSKNLSVTPLGGGSNIVLTGDIAGLVLSVELKGLSHKVRGQAVDVTFAAGENWHDQVLHCLKQGWYGLENLSLIPGNMGAAAIQNIGAYGVELKDVFEHLEAYHITTGEIHNFDCASCRFGYRESVFKNIHKGAYVILSVTFKLRRNANVDTDYGIISEVLNNRGILTPTPKDVSDAVIFIRKSKLPDPKEIGNSGSFFKNPILSLSDFEPIKEKHADVPFYPSGTGQVKVPAAWLIEKAGWKGKRIGNYGVHEKQALVLVNYGGANGSDIYKLALDIQSSVENQFGVHLNMEVNIIH